MNLETKEQMKKNKSTKKLIKNTQKKVFKHIKESGCTNPEECEVVYSILEKLLEGYK